LLDEGEAYKKACKEEIEGIEKELTRVEAQIVWEE